VFSATSVLLRVVTGEQNKPNYNKPNQTKPSTSVERVIALVDQQLRTVHLTAIVDSFPFAHLVDTMPADPAASQNPAEAKVDGRRSVTAFGKRKMKAKVTPHGHASEDTCNEVMKAIRGAYGLSGSTKESRDEFLWTLAEVFVYGTSPEIDWKVVTFESAGVTYNCEHIAAICAARISAPNPVRVWVRDYDRGEIPIRIHALLNSPENVGVRQVMASHYGTTADNARFCFDTSSALLDSDLTFSHAEILLIGQLSAYTLSRATQDSQQRGEVDATSNRAGTVGGVKQVNGTSTAAAPPAERAGFKSLR
jgi:hypothetical protein